MKTRFSRRANHSDAPRVILLPLIDIFMVLLIIFMVTVPVVQRSVKIDVPSSTVSDAVAAKDQLVVALDRQGKIALNGTYLPQKDMLTIVAKEAARAQNTVFVQADKDLSYKEVIALVDALKSQAQVKYVVLATKKDVYSVCR